MQSSTMAQHVQHKTGTPPEIEPREGPSGRHSSHSHMHSGDIVTPRLREIARGVQAGERSRLAEAITLGEYCASSCAHTLFKAVV